MNNNVLGLIFASINDSAVIDLTKQRTMGSIPFGGRYRLIDFPLSNMVNSGIQEVGVITKSNYGSLMDHLGSGQEFDLARKNGGLNIVPPFAQRQIKVYSGRIEALESMKGYLKKCQQKYVIMSDCNFAFNFDFRQLIEAHKKSGADVTLMYRRQEIPRIFTRPNSNNKEFFIGSSNLTV